MTTPSLYQKILEELEESKQFVENGGINCIPNPFPNFRKKFTGIRKKFYFIVTGGTKSAKTQFTNFFFIIHPILYYIEHPDKLKPTILYVPLEETKEEVTMRYYSYILNMLSNGQYQLNSEDLQSVDADKVLPNEVLDMMKSEKFQMYARAYEECVHFITDVRHPTGILKRAEEYFNSHGHIESGTKDVTYTDSMNRVHSERVTFKERYVPDNPHEYVMIVVDHAGLLQQEKDGGVLLTLKQTIEKMSDYNRALRDTYDAIPVLIMQQNSETTNLAAKKEQWIRPTKDGLKDSKRPGEDCTVLLGITNPSSFGFTDYLGYPIGRLKDYFRIVEVVLHRKGRANQLCPLFFNGAINQFTELPPPSQTQEIEQCCQYVERLINPPTNKVMLLFSKIKQLFK